MRYYRRVNIDMILNYISILIYTVVLYVLLLCSVFCCVSCPLQVCVWSDFDIDMLHIQLSSDKY